MLPDPFAQHTGAQSHSRWLQQGSVILNDTGRYWLPLIALYTGCRLGEVMQMTKADVKTEGEITYFDINDDGDKTVKTGTSIRKIPLTTMALATAAALCSDPTFAATQASAPITTKLRMVCGQSDVVWKYIVSVMGEKKAIVNDGSRGRQGETIRHFLLYSDNSWVLIYDFFRRGRPSEEDQACIVASGSQETAYKSTNLLVYELPEEWMGER